MTWCKRLEARCCRYYRMLVHAVAAMSSMALGAVLLATAVPAPVPSLHSPSFPCAISPQPSFYRPRDVALKGDFVALGVPVASLLYPGMSDNLAESSQALKHAADCLVAQACRAVFAQLLCHHAQVTGDVLLLVPTTNWPHAGANGEDLQQEPAIQVPLGNGGGA